MSARPGWLTVMVDQREWPTDDGPADSTDGTARGDITRLEVADVARMDSRVRELAGVASRGTNEMEIIT